MMTNRSGTRSTRCWRVTVTWQRQRWTALEGLSILHRALRPFNLLVTDCNMPGMDGVELGRACLRRNPELGILYLSGSLPGDELLSELETGRRAFLAKPFQSNNLLRKVRQLLAPRFERDSIPASPQLRLSS